MAIIYLNQYTLCASASLREFSYDADGNLLSDGEFTYAYDAENRMVCASNSGIVVTYAYDHRGRMVRKEILPTSTNSTFSTLHSTFVWDGNNIVLESIAFADGSTRICEYFWGLDKSGTEQGAGGVGGLLAVSVDGVFYIPCYDHNGNIVRYVSETGAVAAQYLYDPYGNVVEASGPLADQFAFGFSTKYHDRETGLVAYQQRFYHPPNGRWLNRDPIEEQGGENLYQFVFNIPTCFIDHYGLRTYISGLHGEPHVSFDDDFHYDPNIKPSIGDYFKLAKWKTILDGARFMGHLEDATLLYRHYLEGSGTPMTIDYLKAYNEDSGIAVSIKNAIREAQREAERLSNTEGRKFKMSSDAGIADSYPTTENWQKALGGHSIWGEASVVNCKDSFSMNITLHALDKYNFNNGASDIATGASDNENGRFEELGWAKSFITRGSIVIKVKWKRGNIGEMDVATRDRMGFGRSRARGR